MSIKTDIKKLILKHSVIRYLDYAELDDDVYGLILDKNVELLIEDNKRLKEENTKLKIEGILAEQPTVELEINGTNQVLTKEEFLELVAKYRHKELLEKKPRRMDHNVFIPQEIIGITTGSYSNSSFFCYYRDEFGQKASYISSNAYQKYCMYFDLFNLRVTNFAINNDFFKLVNPKGEEITISTKMTLSNKFFINFAKGKEFIRKVDPTNATLEENEKLSDRKDE